MTGEHIFEIAVATAGVALSFVITAFATEVRVLLRDRPLNAVQGIFQRRRSAMIKEGERILNDPGELVISLASTASLNALITYCICSVGFQLLYKFTPGLRDLSDEYVLIRTIDLSFAAALFAVTASVARVGMKYRQAQNRRLETSDSGTN